MFADNKAQETQPEDFFWQTYLDASKAEDEARPKNWEGSTTGILTFTGLFAATVAAFLVESYKLLSPDTGERTNVLLEHLIIAMANASSQNPIAAPPPVIFSVSPSDIATNVFWFSSLLIALICALLSTLVQEWSRNYVQDINRRKVLHESPAERAFNHIYIRMGVHRYGMDQFVSWIVALVHLSVILFACGLLAFLFPIDHVVAGISVVVLGCFIIIYCAASLIPLLDKSCPYRTPISYMMAFVYWLTLRIRSRLGHPQSTPNFQGLITRQHTTVWPQKFLTDPRFQFAWERTYVHINDDNRGMFFKGLPSLIYLHESQKIISSHMCADRSLMQALFSFLDDSYQYMHRELSSSSIDSDIFELIGLLSEGMYALEVDHYGEHLEDSVITSPWLIDVIGIVTRIAEDDGLSRLSARSCLARVRWSLLLLCRKAFEQGIPALIFEEDVSDFFQETSFGSLRLGSRNPSIILVLLTTGLCRDNFQGWKHTGASTLCPLHDDDCCRDWRNALMPEGLAHVAACNVLTAVAHVLESTDSQRKNSESLLLSILDTFHWDRSFQLPRNDKQKIPSSEFVSVIRSAGLDEWLEPGSTFDTEPRRGPKYDFLNHYPGRRCVHILQKLARYVDFEAYFDRARMQYSNPLAITSILPHNVADTSTHAPTTSSQPSSGDAIDDGTQCSPDKRDAFMTVAQNPLDNPPSPTPQNDPPAPVPVPPSHLANSLPAPETSSSEESIYEDVRGTSREGEPADATGDNLLSSSNAAVTIPSAPSGHVYNAALGLDVHEVKTLNVEGKGNASTSSKQDRASDAATADEVSAEARHEEHVADAFEEVAAMSTPPGVGGQDQQPVNLPESPGLRSVRVDDDRGSHEGKAQGRNA